MTVRLPISTPENTWYDSQPVDAQDLLAEQTHNDTAISGIINNHFGSGVLPLALNAKVLFDSDAVVGLLDGTPLTPAFQPSDGALGVQLELSLKNAKIFGRRNVKVAVIGLDKDGSLQYDTFYFHKNESQITAKHYTSILSILINDMSGPDDSSFNLGGSLVILESQPFAVSRDAVMVAQDQQPNLFWRDFWVKPTSGYTTLTGLLQAAVGSYSVDALGIVTTPRQLRKILANDLSTQIGQKFQAQTNNIQKITVLLGVDDIVDPSWSGDIVLSLYALQSADASTDPAIAITFSPSPSPIAQINFNSTSLADNGIVLSTNVQPVDFVLSNTIVGTAASIVPGNFYAFTIKRSGTTSQGNITIAVGNDLTDNSIETIYNGTAWVDVAQEDLWFKVWTSAVKISDGQAYDLGVGIDLPKVALSTTGLLIDNSLRFKSLSSTREYVALAQASTIYTDIVQDQRTGSPVASRKESSADVSLVLKTDFESSRGTNEPIVLAAVADRNAKNVGASSVQSFTLNAFTFSKNEFVVRLTGDTNSNKLRQAYLSGGLVNAKLIPNALSPSIAYRIAKAEMFDMTYGDMNGDGIVDRDDLITATQMEGMSFAGNTTLATYNSQNTVFADASGISFQLVDPVSGTNIFPGGGSSNYLTGNLVSDPADRTYATFTLSASNFSSVTDITTLRFKTHLASSVGNQGSFIITANPTATTITIHKILMTSDTIMQIMRGSIGDTNSIQPSDIVAISNYVDRVPTNATTGVGFALQAIRITTELLIDRNDDLWTTSGRASSNGLHPVQDIAVNDSLIFANDFTTTTLTFTITNRLSWNDSFILSSGLARQVNCSVSDPLALPLGSPNNPPVTIPLMPPSTAMTLVPFLVAPSTAPGRNDLLVPNNLILGDSVLNRSGGLHKFDIEVGTIVLEAPVADFTEEKTLNIVSTFIASTMSGNISTGVTVAGYSAMRFADGTFVTNDAIGNNQIQFAVSMQSYYPSLDAISPSSTGNTGILIDETAGVSMDYTQGLLTLNFSSVANDPILSTLRTKIQIVAYLKKAGFNNKNVVVNASTLSNLLGL